MLHTVRQEESGTPVAEVCRKMGITTNFYKWKRQAGRHGRSPLTGLRQLEDENKKLKALAGKVLFEVIQKRRKILRLLSEPPR